MPTRCSCEVFTGPSYMYHQHHTLNSRVHIAFTCVALKVSEMSGRFESVSLPSSMVPNKSNEQAMGDRSDIVHRTHTPHMYRIVPSTKTGMGFECTSWACISSKPYEWSNGEEYITAAWRALVAAYCCPSLCVVDTSTDSLRMRFSVHETETRRIKYTEYKAPRTKQVRYILVFARFWRSCATPQLRAHFSKARRT